MIRCEAAELSSVASGRKCIGDSETKQMKARVPQAATAKSFLSILCA